MAQLIVGRETGDDAAAIDLGDGRILLQTADFFAPLVNDPYQFGRVAAANALSDVWAMGGNPLSALALLAWPIDVLGTDSAAQVIAGAQSICTQVGVPLAGGHSVDSKEPFFGLSVNGLVLKAHLKTNAGACAGDVLVLTKGVGSGVAAAVVKRSLATAEQEAQLVECLCALNNAGAALGGVSAVHAMTDVTGFGLGGHLLAMCKASNVGARLKTDQIPLLAINGLETWLADNVVTDNTWRNYNALKNHCSAMNMRQIQLLCDPQTNGGLLLAVAPLGLPEVIRICASRGLRAVVIGEMEAAEPALRLELG